MSRLSVIILAGVLSGGCAAVVGGSGPGGDAEERLRTATAAAERGDFRSASRQLRNLASRCESGAAGREAVLILAAAEIDPRNPRPSPAATAHLAARYLQIREASGSSLAVAETLYLMAVDLGANPVRDPFSPVPRLDGEEAEAAAGSWRVADRFAECGGGEAPGRTVRELPEHPGVPLWRVMRRVRRGRDSLALRADSLEARAEEARRLRARADSLASELERIRSLLQQNPGRPNSPPESDP